MLTWCLTDILIHSFIEKFLFQWSERSAILCLCICVVHSKLLYFKNEMHTILQTLITIIGNVRKLEKSVLTLSGSGWIHYIGFILFLAFQIPWLSMTKKRSRIWLKWRTLVVVAAHQTAGGAASTDVAETGLQPRPGPHQHCTYRPRLSIATLTNRVFYISQDSKTISNVEASILNFPLDDSRFALDGDRYGQVCVCIYCAFKWLWGFNINYALVPG